MGRIRRITEHPTTRVVLLILAGAQAMVGAFILGLSLNLAGTSGAGRPAGTPVILGEAPVPPGPFPLASTHIAGVNAAPESVAVTPDGNLWFTWFDRGPMIGRVDAAGTVRWFPIVSRFAPRGIAAGPDGAVWFTGGDQDGIGRLAPSGQVSWHPIGWRGVPDDITSGPDGNLWFTVHAYANGDVSAIARMTPAGDVTRFPLPTGGRELGPIIAGPDGNLWFAMASGLGRITPAGAFIEVPLVTTLGVPSLAVGPDGAIWFAANAITGAASVGRVEPGREPRVTDQHELGQGADVRAIVAGADGNLWVAENSRNSLARITPGGQVTQFTLSPNRFPHRMVAGRDRTIWVTVRSSALDVAGIDRFEVPR